MMPTSERGKRESSLRKRRALENEEREEKSLTSGDGPVLMSSL